MNYLQAQQTFQRTFGVPVNHYRPDPFIVLIIGFTFDICKFARDFYPDLANTDLAHTMRRQIEKEYGEKIVVAMKLILAHDIKRQERLIRHPFREDKPLSVKGNARKSARRNRLRARAIQIGYRDFEDAVIDLYGVKELCIRQVGHALGVNNTIASFEEIKEVIAANNLRQPNRERITAAKLAKNKSIYDQYKAGVAPRAIGKQWGLTDHAIRDRIRCYQIKFGEGK